MRSVIIYVLEGALWSRPYFSCHMARFNRGAGIIAARSRIDRQPSGHIYSGIYGLWNGPAAVSGLPWRYNFMRRSKHFCDWGLLYRPPSPGPGNTVRYGEASGSPMSRRPLRTDVEPALPGLLMTYLPSSTFWCPNPYSASHLCLADKCDCKKKQMTI